MFHLFHEADFVKVNLVYSAVITSTNMKVDDVWSAVLLWDDKSAHMRLNFYAFLYNIIDLS